VLDGAAAPWDNSSVPVTSPRRAWVPAVLVSVALAVAACSDGGDREPVVSATSLSPTPAPGASEPATPMSPSPAESDGPAGPEVAFPADRAADTAPAERSGDGLTVVDVRVGAHDGYDRLVLELAGEGTVGWRVEYDDDPRTPGEGAQVDLAGDATLSILLDGVG